MEENKKNKIPNVPNLGSYSYVKLGDISEVITKGTTAKKFLNDGVAFIKIESINSRTTLGNKLSYISEEEHKTYLKRSILKEGDILFSIAGALGIVHIVQKEELPANTNQALSIIRLKQKEKIEYVSWFLETPSIKKMILELKSIGAQPNLSLEQISNIKIPMLSSNKLEHIVVELLNTIEKRIETQNKIIEELKTLKAAISDLIFKALKCENIIIEKLCSITTGKLDANAGNPNGKYRFYTCAEEYSFIDNYSFDCEAILISGNGANVGYVHQYSGKFNAYQRTYVLYDFKGISPTYLKYYLEVFLKQKINAEKNTGNTPYIRLNTIAKMAIKKPDKTTQEKIVSALDKISEKLSIEIRKIDLFKKQKSYFLSNLFI